jgi:hypothetical protein
MGVSCLLLAWAAFVVFESLRFQRRQARRYWRMSDHAEWHMRLANHLLEERSRLIREGVELHPIPRRIIRDVRPGATERWARMRNAAEERARKRGRRLIRAALR